jgi:AcrR family transcriptional regulator
MPRPSRSAERRRELLPRIARAFAELGYRRTTTSELARRCQVRENILYRLWPDKKAMFIACIDYVYDLSRDIWQDLLERSREGSDAAALLLGYESTHHGEFGFYRIVFAGLSETDDPEIRKALGRMYRRFHRFVRDQVRAHRSPNRRDAAPDAQAAAWAILGLGTVANIGREFSLLSAAARARLIRDVGRLLLDGHAP